MVNAVATSMLLLRRMVREPIEVEIAKPWRLIYMKKLIVPGIRRLCKTIIAGEVYCAEN